MTAYAFAIGDLATGRRLGHAAICPLARYASVAYMGADRLGRRSVRPADWIALERFFSGTIEPGPLDADGPVSRVLLSDNRRSIVVQYLYSQPIEEGPDAATNLDRLLKGLAEPETRLRLE